MNIFFLYNNDIDTDPKKCKKVLIVVFNQFYNELINMNEYEKFNMLKNTTNNIIC